MASEAPAITSFVREHGFLSNFAATPFLFTGVVWPTVEHAYQAAKATDSAAAMWVFKASTPAEAKKRGRRIEIRPDWEERKLLVMEALLRAKFARGSLLARALVGTGDAELVEGNWWGDTYWGKYGGVGENHLGELLMKIRAELREG